MYRNVWKQMYIHTHTHIDTCTYPRAQSYTYRVRCPYMCNCIPKSDCYSLFTTYLVLQSLEPFYDQFDPDFINIRKTVREVLQKEDDLNEIVQLVGKVSRPNLHVHHVHHCLHAVCCVQLVDKVSRSQPYAYP